MVGKEKEKRIMNVYAMMCSLVSATRFMLDSIGVLRDPRSL